jgi:hypothetical protein
MIGHFFNGGPQAPLSNVCIGGGLGLPTLEGGDGGLGGDAGGGGRLLPEFGWLISEHLVVNQYSGHEGKSEDQRHDEGEERF